MVNCPTVMLTGDGRYSRGGEGNRCLFVFFILFLFYLFIFIFSAKEAVQGQ